MNKMAEKRRQTCSGKRRIAGPYMAPNRNKVSALSKFPPVVTNISRNTKAVTKREETRHRVTSIKDFLHQLIPPEQEYHGFQA